MKMLIHPPVETTRLEKIIEAAGGMTVCNAESFEDALREVADADAFFGKMTPELLAAARQLKWVQSPTASLEHYLFPELIEHPCQLSNMRGLFSDVIADHVMGYVLCFARNLHLYMRRQMKGRWAPVGNEEMTEQALLASAKMLHKLEKYEDVLRLVRENRELADTVAPVLMLEATALRRLQNLEASFAALAKAKAVAPGRPR